MSVGVHDGDASTLKRVIQLEMQIEKLTASLKTMGAASILPAIDRNCIYTLDQICQACGKEHRWGTDNLIAPDDRPGVPATPMGWLHWIRGEDLWNWLGEHQEVRGGDHDATRGHADAPHDSVPPPATGQLRRKVARTANG